MKQSLYRLKISYFEKYPPFVTLFFKVTESKAKTKYPKKKQLTNTGTLLCMWTEGDEFKL